MTKYFSNIEKMLPFETIIISKCLGNSIYGQNIRVRSKPFCLFTFDQIASFSCNIYTLRLFHICDNFRDLPPRLNAPSLRLKGNYPIHIHFFLVRIIMLWH